MKVIKILPDKSYRFVCLGIIAGACLTFLGSILLEWVVILGEKIPQTDLTGDYFWGTLWALILGTTILIWPVSWADKNDLVIVWFVKALTALSVVLLYEYAYDIDSTGYYFAPMTDDFIYHGFSLKLTDRAYSVERGTWNISTLSVYQNLILSGSYHALKISYCMAGVVGGYLYFCASKVLLGYRDRRLFYIFVFFPSIFFWSSLPGKEAVTLAATGLYSYGVISWYKFRKFKYVLMILAGGIFAMYLRVWGGLILFIPVLVLIPTMSRNVFTRWIVFLVVGGLVGFTAQQFTKTFRLNSFEDVFVKSQFHGKHARGGSVIEVEKVEYRGVSTLIVETARNFPKVLFRPFPGEVPSLPGLLAGLEGVLLLMMFVRAVYNTKLGELKNPLVLWAIGVVVIWASIYALSANNLGTIVRWRVQILPIFLGLLLYLGRDKQREAEVSSPDFPVTAGQNSGL
jgi:hypothetical protein